MVRTSPPPFSAAPVLVLVLALVLALALAADAVAAPGDAPALPTAAALAKVPLAPLEEAKRLAAL